MRIAMAQMRMSGSVNENLEKTIRFIGEAKHKGAELILFPEVQLSPFFAQYEGESAEQYLLTLDSPEIKAIQNACRQFEIYASPNVYLNINGKCYDASLMIDDKGEIVGISKMVYIAQAENFHEQDYYTPSDEGVKVYDTPFGKIGIVICFDRHLPESVRECALAGAQLILIPTANLTQEPMELFEWEVRVQAFQNLAYIAMCNRVGQEDEITFCGQSLIADPSGGLILKAGSSEELIVADVDIERVDEWRRERPWLELAKGRDRRSEGVI